MSAEKKKLYSIAINMLIILNQPTSIMGFDVKAIIWQNILKLTDNQAQIALIKLKAMVNA
jgi:hypothetical protein